MIDLILASFVVGVFAAGFYFGGKYKTFSEMKDAFIQALK